METNDSFGYIVISGLGKTFDDILVAAVDGLIAAGAIVEVHNEHPPEQQQIELLRENIKGQKVTVMVKHLPWGG